MENKLVDHESTKIEHTNIFFTLFSIFSVFFYVIFDILIIFSRSFIFFYLFFFNISFSVFW